MTKEEQNRILYPWTASLVDQFREVFGQGVTVKQTTEKPNKETLERMLNTELKEGR